MMKNRKSSQAPRLERIELSERNKTLRWILIVVLLAVAVVAVIIGLMSALQTEPGWQTVEAASTQMNCSDAFVLNYDYGRTDQSPSMESKALEILYGGLTEEAWQLFANEAGESDLSGLYFLNQHPNEEVSVSEPLYKALVQLEESGSRILYLAPVYAAYERVFYSENETYAAECDPTRDEDTQAYVRQLAAFACDREAIDLKLSESGWVQLFVSEEYLNFAKTHELEYFLDFGWTRNAFIADFLAEGLSDEGFTNGYLSSYDGFTRNLDSSGNTYNLNLFHRRGDMVDLAGVMEYTAPSSLIYLRDYPMYDLDARQYYTFSDGRTVTSMVDPADGMCKSALPELVGYSTTRGCAEMLLSLLPVYVTEEFSPQTVNALAQENVHCIWFEGNSLCYNQEHLPIRLNQVEGVDYTAKFIAP